MLAERHAIPASVVQDMTAELLANEIVGSRFTRKLALSDFISEEPELIAEILARAWKFLPSEDQDLLLERAQAFIEACPGIIEGVASESKYD